MSKEMFVAYVTEPQKGFFLVIAYNMHIGKPEAFVLPISEQKRIHQNLRIEVSCAGQRFIQEQGEFDVYRLDMILMPAPDEADQQQMHQAVFAFMQEKGWTEDVEMDMGELNDFLRTEVMLLAPPEFSH